MMMKICMRLFLFGMTMLLLTGCSKSIHHERIYIPKHGPHVEKEKVALAPTIPKGDTNLLIVIDAGHGGKDDGTQSLNQPKFLEKHLTLTTAKMLNTYLQGYGYRTYMTREDDTFISLSKRAEMANEKDTHLFVSVHYNAAENRSANGIEVYYYKSDKDEKRTKDSKTLATSILDDVISETSAKSRGVKHGNFAVIRETKMPAILIEGGFMTNEDEMSKIKNASYMKKIAWGIAQGVKNYLHPNK
ncbi:MAG: N-acetylmuramoyl-L-alanine amidase [Chlamydiota bacterium]